MSVGIAALIADIETIAAGRAILQLLRLRKRHGQDRWGKLRGSARSASPAARCGVPRSTGMGRLESNAFATDAAAVTPARKLVGLLALSAGAYAVGSGSRP